MTNVRLSLPSILVIVAVASAAAFAAGRSMSPATGDATPSSPPPRPPSAAMAVADDDPPLPPGHAPTAGPGPLNAQQPLPAGHPPVDSKDPSASPLTPPTAQESALEYKAPARWVLVPNANSMRLATYRVPRAPGDTEDADLSITQAGGSVEANADRWVGQFDAASQKTAKRSTRNVGALAVTIVEVQGRFEGGMGKDAGTGWALLGAIVATAGMPHFFKLTGPAKTVLAARAEFDTMMGSLVQH